MGILAIRLGKFHHDLTVLPHWESMVYKRNHPEIALIHELYLVGGLEHFLFSHILGIIISID